MCDLDNKTITISKLMSQEVTGFLRAQNREFIAPRQDRFLLLVQVSTRVRVSRLTASTKEKLRYSGEGRDPQNLLRPRPIGVGAAIAEPLMNGSATT